MTEKNKSEEFKVLRYNKSKKEFFKKEEKKKRIVLKIKIIMILLIVVLFFSTIFAILNLGSDKIILGVQIDGKDVSGLTKKEAIEKIKNTYSIKENKPIGLKYGEYIDSINPQSIEVKYQLEDAINKAYKIGRDNNIFISNYEIIKGNIIKENINVDVALNEQIIRQNLEDINIRIPEVLVESSYRVEDNKLIINKGRAGVIINTDEMIEIIKKGLSNYNETELNFVIPVIEKQPSKIDIEKVHRQIFQEVKDAYFEKDPFAIYPEIEGRDFNIEEANEILEKEEQEYIIPLKITKPKVTINEINADAFNEEISKYTTRFDVTSKNRTNNLVLACEKINNKVILPGQEFSFNKELGPRTESAGYKKAKVYESGKVVDGIGGGICQISSTLYNAVIDANLEVTERRNHQFITSYVPVGRDATVVYGMTDFKFKNTRKYPIKVRASAKNGIAEVSILGIKEENEYEFKITNKVIDSIPAPIKYVDDKTIEEGKEIVEDMGVNGLKIETYITKMLKGKIISTTLLSRDTYNPMEKVIRRGIKK